MPHRFVSLSLAFILLLSSCGSGDVEFRGRPLSGWIEDLKSEDKGASSIATLALILSEEEVSDEALRRVLTAFGQQGARAAVVVDAIASFLERRADSELGTLAGQVIARIGDRGEIKLLALSGDTRESIRRHALESLVFLSEWHAGLSDSRREALHKAISQRLTEASAAILAPALRALKNFQLTEIADVSRCIELLSFNEKSVRVAARDLLGPLALPQNFVQSIVASMEAGSAEAAQALGRLGPRASVAVGKLRAKLHDASADIELRCAAAISLGTLAGADDQTARQLGKIATAASEPEALRVAALDGLAEMESEPLQMFLAQLMASTFAKAGTVDFRLAAIRALGRHAESRRAEVASLLERLIDPKSEPVDQIRFEAAIALATLGHPSKLVTEEITSAIRRGDKSRIIRGMDALRALGASASGAKGEILKHVVSDDPLIVAASALALFAVDRPAAVEVLRAIPNEVESEVGAKIVAGLSEIAVKDLKALGLLLPRINSGPVQVRLDAIAALENLDRNIQRVDEELRGLYTDEDKYVRQAAIRTIAILGRRSRASVESKIAEQNAKKEAKAASPENPHIPHNPHGPEFFHKQIQAPDGAAAVGDSE